MKALTLVLLAVVLTGNPVRADGFTGGYVYDRCHDRTSPDWEKRDQWICASYIRGLVDGVSVTTFYATDSPEAHAKATPFCTPPGNDMNTTIDVVVRYIQAHPTDRERAAALVVYEALSRAWPCQR